MSRRPPEQRYISDLELLFTHNWLHAPDLLWLLLTAGVLAISGEFLLPGSVLPGASGLALVMMAIAGFYETSVNWWGATLLLLAVAIVVVRAKLAPRMNSLSRVGLTLTAALVTAAGARILTAQIHPLTAISTALTLAFTLTFLLSAAERARCNKRDALAFPVRTRKVDMLKSGKT